jgi:hypothetical protein
MKMRLFAVEILNDNETKLSFDTIIPTDALDEWREDIGKSLEFKQHSG